MTKVSVPVTGVASIVVFTGQLERAVAFYRALGVPLEDEDHGDGEIHSAGDVGGVHVAVYPGAAPGSSPGWRAAGSTFTGFWVNSLETVLAALKPLGAQVLQDHQDREWGCRVVVADPDGRAVELNQRDHCPGG
jgi:catechol 2,3-dioxygenase-like lactoylglutathione lyase family enzyme